MQTNDLREILERYGFDNLVEKMNDLENEVTLKIGFLGEFSSGKSGSVINSVSTPNFS